MNNELTPERVKSHTGEAREFIRWTVELPDGQWIDAWDKESLDAYRAAIIAAERERCAKICEDHAIELNNKSLKVITILEYFAGKADGSIECANLIRQFTDDLNGHPAHPSMRWIM